jgi:hypothetical protein
MIYELAHIYIIYDIKDHNLIYYGSTCDLKARMNKHKCLKTNDCTSRQIIERGNYKYAILETHENIDEYDLVERERWYIKNKVCINKVIPHRTRAEYLQDNKEKITEYHQKYRQDNKEKITEYYQDNKEKIAERTKEYYQNNKEKITERTKEYYQDNKEKLAEYYQKYRQDNKKKITERQNEKFVCECGGKFTKTNTAQHKRSKKHLKWIQSCKI